MCIIVVYLDELCTFVPNITLCGEDAIDKSVRELSQPDDGISFSEKQISQRALAAKQLLKRRWEVSIAVYYYLDDFAWIL